MKNVKIKFENIFVSDDHRFRFQSDCFPSNLVDRLPVQEIQTFEEKEEQTRFGT
jgi:hypothetical protein